MRSDVDMVVTAHCDIDNMLSHLRVMLLPERPAMRYEKLRDCIRASINQLELARTELEGTDAWAYIRRHQGELRAAFDELPGEG